MVRFDFILYYLLSKFIGKPDILSHWLNYGDGSYDNKNVVLLKLEFLLAQVIEEITFKDKEQNLLTDIYYSNRLGQQGKLVVKAVIELW